MLPNRKIILLVFSLTLIASVTLSIIYFRESGGCFTKISANSLNVRIKNKSLWQNYIDAIGNCSNGNFTVYLSPDAPKQARSVIYSFTDTVQLRSLVNQDKKILFTYDIAYNEGKKEANIILNFPEINELDENRISSALFFTSFTLFTGETYTQRVEKLVKYDSLVSMGLTYEKR